MEMSDNPTMASEVRDFTEEALYDAECSLATVQAALESACNAARRSGRDATFQRIRPLLSEISSSRIQLGLAIDALADESE